MQDYSETAAFIKAIKKHFPKMPKKNYAEFVCVQSNEFIRISEERNIVTVNIIWPKVWAVIGLGKVDTKKPYSSDNNQTYMWNSYFTDQEMQDSVCPPAIVLLIETQIIGNCCCPYI